MLTDFDISTYNSYFPVNPHPFISAPFIELNKNKADVIIRLAESTQKPLIGLVAGIKEGMLYSPFSAPFGGFHFLKQNIYVSEIDNFLKSLQSHIVSKGYSGIELIIPPDIYHPTFNAKTINCLVRNGFEPAIPEVTNWVELNNFNGVFSQRNSREYYNQAVRFGLTFNLARNETDKENIYDLISSNRAKFGRPIFMTLKDITDTAGLWPVDFFKVNETDGTLVASAIFYQSHPEICYAAFWGDNETGRPLRAMDFLAFNLWTFYKNKGYKYIDLGISTENGHPNEGLLRFKESHEGSSSLRYKFTWKVK